MIKNVRGFVLLAALGAVLAAGLVAQQMSADKAIDPVCGMTVVKATAKATYDYKGTTYYFCNPGCKDAFMKDPEKYLKAQKEKMAAAPAAKEVQGMPMGQMMHGQMGQMKQEGMATCPMCGGPMGQMKHGGLAGCAMCGGPMGMGMMHARMGMMGGGMMAPGLAPMFRLYGDKIEIAVENTKDGAMLKVTSKDPEVAKAIQVHLAEHVAMMKKMMEARKTGEGMAKMPMEGCCANCPMMKK
jgi:YHS domain-containing protein